MTRTLSARQMETLIANGQELMQIKAFLPPEEQEAFHAPLKRMVTEYIDNAALPAVADVRQVFEHADRLLPDSQHTNSARQRLRRIRDDIDLTRPSPSSGSEKNGGGRGAA